MERATLWIAPERGFALTKAEIRNRLKSRTFWSGVFHWEYGDWEFTEGIWIARRVVNRRATYGPDGSERLVQSFDDRAIEFEVNPELADEIFRVAFPDGIPVNDQVRNRVYYARSTTEEAFRKSDDQKKLTELQKVLAAREAREALPRRLAIVAALLALTAGTVGLILALRSPRRRKRGGTAVGA